MSIVEDLKKMARNCEENAADYTASAASKRAEADRMEAVAQKDMAKAAEYYLAAKEAELKMGTSAQTVSDPMEKAGESIGSSTIAGHDADAHRAGYLREQALEYASRLGGHQTEVINAAEMYYAFLTGTKPQQTVKF